jgi:diacylglycerol kinase (ATP)
VEYFLESAALGLSAIVLPAGQGLRKGRLAKFSSAFLKLFELKPGPIEVELDDGQKIQANSRLVTVSNAPLLRLSFLVAPDAKMDDGLFDIAVYDGMTTTEITAHFAATSKARCVDDPRIRFYRSRRVIILSTQRLAVAADPGADFGQQQWACG